MPATTRSRKLSGTNAGRNKKQKQQQQPRAGDGRKRNQQEEQEEEEEEDETLYATQLDPVLQEAEEEDEDEDDTGVAAAAATRPAKKTTNTDKHEHGQVGDEKQKSTDEEEEWDDDDSINKKPAAKQKQKSSSPGSSTDEEEKGDEEEEDSNNNKKPPPAAAKQEGVKIFAVQHKDDLLFDILDYESEIIICDRKERRSRWKVFKDFYFMLPKQTREEKQFGRIYVKSKMCSILRDVCTTPAYSDSDGSLVPWIEEQWEELRDDWEHLKEVCIRQDAEVRVKSDTKPDDTHHSRRNEKIFTSSHKYIARVIEVNRLLAPIRVELQNALEEGSLDKIEERAVRTVYKHCLDATVDDDKFDRFMARLFLPKDDVFDFQIDKKLAEAQPVLQDIVDLRKVMEAPPFDLSKLQERLETVIQKMNDEIFFDPEKKPVLIDLEYRLPPNFKEATLEADVAARKIPSTPSRAQSKSGSKRKSSGKRKPIKKPKTTKPKILYRQVGSPTVATIAVASLKRDRAALRDNHGDDPLEESRDIAEEATGIPKVATSRKKRQKKSRMDDSDDDVEDFDDTEEERATLSKISKRKSYSTGRKAVEQVMYVGPPPDAGVFDEHGKVIRRQRWTEEETNAILAGTEKHGEGKWLQIKNHYGDILRNRTTVMIKDRYRTLKKKGRVQGEPDAAGGGERDKEVESGGEELQEEPSGDRLMVQL